MNVTLSQEYRSDVNVLKKYSKNLVHMKFLVPKQTNFAKCKMNMIQSNHSAS